MGSRNKAAARHWRPKVGDLLDYDDGTAIVIEVLPKARGKEPARVYLQLEMTYTELERPRRGWRVLHRS